MSKFKKIIVKPAAGGSSFGISICKDIESFKASIEKGFSADDTILLEQFITGREFTCGVVRNPKKLEDNIALSIVEIKCSGKEFFDFEAKYEGASEEICPAEISKKLSKNIKNISLNIFNIFKLEDLARIDYIVDDQENIFALDVNTIPGMTAVSLLPQELEQEGISLGEFFDALIQHKLR